MHRNTFLKSPGKLTFEYELIGHPGVFFAGQITGVEGYVESAASGLLAAIGIERRLKGLCPIDFSRETALGALGHYVSEYNGSDFQPMNINFSIMAPPVRRLKNKQERNLALSERSLKIIDNLKAKIL